MAGSKLFVVFVVVIIAVAINALTMTTSSSTTNAQQPYFSAASFNACMVLSLPYTCLAHFWIFFQRQYNNNNTIQTPFPLPPPPPSQSTTSATGNDDDDDKTKNHKKIAIITGSNTGIGYETAKALAVDYGWEVVLACRSRDKAIRAMESINNQATSGIAIVLDEPLDLSSFQSVRKYAEAIQERYPNNNIQVLINNAGLNTSGKSDDNLDLLFQSNYLGHFLLTNLLVDKLKGGGRIINLSSVMHHFSGSKPKDEKFWKNMATYHQKDTPSELYAASKLAMLFFSHELNRRYYSTDAIQSIAVNPGSVFSDIWRGFPNWLQTIFRYVYLSPQQGCAPAVAAAVLNDGDFIPATTKQDNELYYFQPYWIPTKDKSRPMIPFTEMLGPYVGYTATTPRLPSNDNNMEEAKALWRVSGDLTR